MSSLYTFIMDYLGGTYISQVEAESNSQAMLLWIENLNAEEIKGFSNADKKRLMNGSFNDEDFTLINGLINVWCVTVQTKKGFGIINFVKTAPL
jgi:hypothetical protein